MSYFLILAWAVVAAAPVAQQDVVAEKPAEERKSCRAKEVPTGSIMRSRRICLTKNEWAVFDEHNRRQTDTALNARRVNNPPVE
jgi:hypothetical protein